jgi:endonuclease/exonuclease/phosphatase family metal-dependent hydrolase
VLVTEIELPGPGANLELVSTHLIAGGDLADTSRHRRATDEVRFAQVEDVLAEADVAHRPGNLILVVGDFNVPAGGPAGDRLHEVMDAAGYRDLWLDHGAGPGWTCDALVVGEPVTTPDLEDGRFCEEPAAHHPDAERLDYAFIGSAPPQPAVTVQSMRRRVFPRSSDCPEYESMPLLSDHVALHLDLTVGD